MLNLIQAALNYADNSLNPIPCKDNKAPLLEPGHPFLYEPINDIENRFRNASMIGIAAGAVSDGIECIDFDGHQDQAIEEIFTQFANDPFIHELLENGYASAFRTRSGGYHFVIKSDFFEGNTKLAYYSDNNTMIETRGNGGYFITYPSRGYKLAAGVELEKLERIEKHERDYIMNFARSFNKGTKESTSGEKSGRKWPEQFDDNTIFGHFNNTAENELFELLKSKGWTIPERRQAPRHKNVIYWRRPGKVEKDGISATWGHMHNMFYVFSSNCEPFESQKGYTIVDVFILLKFNNDFKAFKNWLAKKYDVKIPEVDRPKIERFPVDVFPVFNQNLIDEMHAALNYNKDFISIAMMFVYATLNGNRNKLRVKNGWISPTIFWSIAIGDPGTMKTHPLSTIIAPLQNIDKGNKNRYDQDMAQWEALNEPDEKHRGKSKAKDPKPIFKQMLVNDYTLEALHEVHSFNKNGIGLYRDEIVGFLNDMNKYRKGSDEQFWLESFNNKSYMINRVSKKPLLIDNISINIVGSIQPEILMKVIGEVGNNGLLDRFLFTIAETDIKPMTLEDMDSSWLAYWDSHVNQVYSNIQNQPENYIYEMTEDAKKAFVDIDKKLVEFQKSEEEPAAIKNYVSKMKTYIPRFALLMYLVECWFEEHDGQYIEASHIYKAEKICNYFINSARYVLTENAQKKEIRSVSRALNGRSNAEKIMILLDKGYKNKDIAKELEISPAYVSRVIKENKEKLTKVEPKKVNQN
jgi:hypothetical protein